MRTSLPSVRRVNATLARLAAFTVEYGSPRTGAKRSFVYRAPCTALREHFGQLTLTSRLRRHEGQACVEDLVVEFAGDSGCSIYLHDQKAGQRIDIRRSVFAACDDDGIDTLGSDVTVFSFYANKTITTGEGGMLVTRDPAIAARAKVMRLHGINRDAFDRFTAKVPSWYYEIVAPGFKYNLTDIAAAMGIHQLQRARGFQEKRARLAALYDELLADLPLITPPKPADGDTHSWHLYVVRLTDAAPIARDALIEALYAAGIGCSVHYIPLHLHPYWRERYDLKAEDFPHSQHAYERMVSLPLYTRMTEADVHRVVIALRTQLGC